MHCSRQQCLVAEWLGLGVTVRVRVRAREWKFPFFVSVLVNTKCDRTTLSWCNERYVYEEYLHNSHYVMMM